MFFSERYCDLIINENGNPKCQFCEDVNISIKQQLEKAMKDFAEPQTKKLNRYNPYAVNTTALDQAINKLNDKLGYPCVDLNSWDEFLGAQNHTLYTVFTPYLFDIIELQYEELSKKEKVEFEKTLNKIFQDNDTAWLIHDGRMVKIDSLQFEMDLKIRAFQKMKELKDSHPKFESAYQELLSAFESFEKQNYTEAINNAGKSYESVLKISCSQQRGNADKLTKEWMNNNNNSILPSMTPEGFREKVLMSLPYIRNNSAASHGSGEIPIIVTKEMAKLALDLAASLDVFIVEEYKKQL